MTRYLAIAPYAWGRDENRKAAERKALREVPRVYVPKPYLLAVYKLEGERADEVYVDEMGRVMLPPGTEAEKVYSHNPEEGA